MARYIQNIFKELETEMLLPKNTNELNTINEIERARKRIRGVSKKTPRRNVIMIDPLTLQKMSFVKSKKSSGNYNILNKKVKRVDTPIPIKNELFRKKTPEKKKSCPIGKMLNPKTNRCVKIKNNNKNNIKKKKSCPDGKILNPKTNRCVKNKN